MGFKYKLKIISLLLLSVFLIPIYAQENNNIIIAGGDNNYPPFEYLEEDYIPVGFNIDIIRAVSKVMQLNIEINLEQWADIKSKFERNEVDMLQGMYYSSKRAGKYLFSAPLITMHQAVFRRKKSPVFNSVSDLKGREVIVQKGDIMHEYAVNNNLTDNLVIVESPEEGFRLLSSGKHDFLLSSRITGLFWIKNLNLENISTGDNIASFRYCFAVSKNNTELLNKLNEGLIIIRQTGLYNEIYEKWFSSLDADFEKYKKTIEIIKIVVSVLSALLIIFIFWSWSLRKTVRLRTADLEEEIEKHKNAEYELKESRELYKTLFSEFTEGVILTDVSTYKIISFNRKVYDILEIDDYNYDDFNLSDYFVFNSIRELWNHFNKITEIGYDSFETSVRSKKGKIINLIVNAKLISVGNRDIIQSIWIDVTEKKELEMKLRQAGKLEAVGTLAGGIAHDFNNILAAVMGYSEVAGMIIGENNPGWAEINEIQKASTRAKDIIRQILLFSRNDLPGKEVFNINEVIDESWTFLRSAIPKTIKLLRDTDKNTGNVYSDRTQLYQVILNLCTNAAHAMEKTGGTITVKLSEAGRNNKDFILLSVSDTGPGIDAESINRIFDPYYTTKETGKGSGLGLSVVHGIVEENNGIIEVDNNPGYGVSFNIFLPLCKKNRVNAETDDKVSYWGNEIILVVDDEPAIADIVSRYLELSGYSVISEVSSKEAKEIIISETGEIDMLITDQLMPDYTGTELASYMKQHRQVPVLMMTGYSDDLEDIEEKNHDIDKIILKPVSRNTLLKNVRQMLDKNRHR